MKILILNGPNLNLLGKRETAIYGHQSFETFFTKLQFDFKDIELAYQQSNIEGELITQIQNADQVFDGIVLNAGAYTHTSIAIGDAIKSISIPVVEVHISNTFNRESYRHTSFISPNAKGIIIGFGLKSYVLGIHSLLDT
ncbi:type II 3-dehydroquinate dehydratase [Aquimarina sp. W85]|uniref:type II 3-dehydroquinate dehydratase n=1 Tax=Aquimarina rhodophyticola TaxID=3342246 RepID=UPI00366CEEB3